jgi:uncharacterized protein involved in exopolysaccharide biosynthesis
VTHERAFGEPMDAPESPAQTVWKFWLLCREHWRAIVALPLLFAVVAGAFTILRPRTFSSAATFMGSSENSDLARAAGLGSIASQFGLRMSMGDAAQSPQFYADLLRSRQIQDSVVETKFTFHDADGQLRTETLIDFYKAPGATPGIRVENAMARLDRLTGVAVGAETGVVRLSVATTSAELSRAIVARYLQLVNAFNLETRQSRATAERKFTQTRMEEALVELHTAEDRLSEFRRRNHSFGTNSELSTEEERLSRDVALRSQLYSVVAQAFEQARVDEVRDTPVITVVEAPYLPARPDPRGLLRALVLGATLGVLAALAYVVVVDSRPRYAIH